MPANKADIYKQLQQDILQMQGFKTARSALGQSLGLGPLLESFPNETFPLAAIHEFICRDNTGSAATGGFVSALLARLMDKEGAVIWISAARTVFPMALTRFGITPERIIFIDLKKEKDVLWAMEEGLKCPGLAAVVGEVGELSFTASRRLQLAVEESRVTGFILRHQQKATQTNACMARWQITPLPSVPDGQLPGIGFPHWQVSLLKVRNGKPGSWDITWKSGRFVFTPSLAQAIQPFLKKKTG